MARILVIDSLDGDRVREALQSRRHTVVIADNAADGLAALPVVDPHIVVMDHQLSDMSGLMLLPKIGHRPLIVLSAADDQQTRVMALRAGADDFIRKPWDDDDLVERVAAVMRRSYRSPLMIGDVLTVGELTLEYGSVRVGGLRLDLTKTEHLLLTSVAHQVGRVVPREEVLETMYGTPDAGEWHTVQVHLGRLRRKLLEAGVRMVSIRTVGAHGLSMEHVSGP